MTILTTTQQAVTYDPATHKLVPLKPTEKMVNATFAGLVEGQSMQYQMANRAEMNRRLTLAIAAAPAAPSGWMPIESAPKDRKILVCQGRNGIICTAWGIDKYGNWKTGASAMDVIVEVTHWMPIPAPPAPKEK